MNEDVERRLQLKRLEGKCAELLLDESSEFSQTDLDVRIFCLSIMLEKLVVSLDIEDEDEDDEEEDQE